MGAGNFTARATGFAGGEVLWASVPGSIGVKVACYKVICLSMGLSPYGKILLGSALIAFGITTLVNFTLVKAVLYFAAALLAAIFFL